MRSIMLAVVLAVGVGSFARASPSSFVVRVMRGVRPVFGEQLARFDSKDAIAPFRVGHDWECFATAVEEGRAHGGLAAQRFVTCSHDAGGAVTIKAYCNSALESDRWDYASAWLSDPESDEPIVVVASCSL